MNGVVISGVVCLPPFVTFASNIRIGSAFQANLYSYVEHDCEISDFVAFARDAKCNGDGESSTVSMSAAARSSGWVASG